MRQAFSPRLSRCPLIAGAQPTPWPSLGHLLWWNRCHGGGRSEEHTSELQSQSNLVCRLLLEKKKSCRLDSRTTQRVVPAMTRRWKAPPLHSSDLPSSAGLLNNNAASWLLVVF